jgi:hypothetical protein
MRGLNRGGLYFTRTQQGKWRYSQYRLTPAMIYDRAFVITTKVVVHGGHERDFLADLLDADVLHESEETEMPKIQEASLRDLHPTQLTVGLIVVQDKKKHLAAMSPSDRQSFMKAHPMPAVIGPQGKLYITDHHHLGRAALDAAVTNGFFLVEADLSKYTMEDFWKEMNKNQWVHPLDENGVRHYYSMIPDRLGKLVDDSYRSLAGYVRDAGGYEKTPTAFAEFIWADFFRRNIPIEAVHADFQAAVRAALPLAQSHWAKNIPGFNGK